MSEISGVSESSEVSAVSAPSEPAETEMTDKPETSEIRRLLARLGYKVRRLHRTAIGPLTIKGLAAGQWRMLRAAEVHRLKKTAGMGATAKVAKKHAVKKHR